LPDATDSFRCVSGPHSTGQVLELIKLLRRVPQQVVLIQ
jgi:hypothetical protein